MRTHQAILLRMVVGLAAVGSSAASGAQVYWLNGQGNALKRANLDGSDVQTVLSGSALGANPARIAVDPIGGKLYWTGGDVPNDQFVKRCNLDGSIVETPYSITPTWDLITNLAVDAANQRLYWTAGTKILRANTDGTGAMTIIPIAAGDFRGLAVDEVRDKVYWVDIAYCRIMRANIDGTGLETLLSGICASYGVGIDSGGAKLYWGEGAGSAGTGCIGPGIRRANLDGQSAVYAITTGVFAPTALSFNGTDGKVYWRDELGNRIVRANANGTGVESIITDDTYLISGFAIDAVCTEANPTDFDGDGIPDGCDRDADNDGVPNDLDDCPNTSLGSTVDAHGRPRGDANLDCVVNGDDIGPIIQVLLGGPN